jgi:hypothetical protein
VSGRLGVSHRRIASRGPRVVRRTQRVQRIVKHVRITGSIALLETTAAQAPRHRAGKKKDDFMSATPHETISFPD